MNFTRKAIIALILISVLLSTGYLVKEKIEWERDNKSFSLVVTESGVEGLHIGYNLEETKLLNDLKGAGVKGVIFDRKTLDLPVNPGKASLYRETGMSLGLKISTPVLDADENLNKIKSSVEKISASILVFQEPKILESYGEVMGWIKEKEIPVGVVEFDYMGFPTELAEQEYRRIARYHRIDSDEKGSLEDQVDRFVRAVKERNIGLIEFRLMEEYDLERNLSAVESTIKRLENLGYRSVSPNQVKGIDSPLKPNKFVYLPLIIASFWFGFFLLGQLFGMNEGKIWPLITILGSSLSIILYFYEPLLLRQVAALGFAVTGPPIIYLFIEKIRKSFSSDIKRALIGIIGATFLACFFGLLLSSTLSDYRFFLKLYQFRGVKISFTLPILLVFLLALKDKDFRWKNIEFGWKEIFLITGFFALIGVFLTRSGNEALIPVMKFESSTRSWLESNLVARPRFKEFLIGHPALLLWLYIDTRFKNKLYWIGFLMP